MADQKSSQNQPVTPAAPPAPPPAPAPATKLYQLKKGVKHHLHHGEKITAGGVVHLTDEGFHALRDKFEPVKSTK